MPAVQTLSQVVRPEVPHLPWRVITEQGLQDAGPLSMIDNQTEMSEMANMRFSMEARRQKPTAPTRHRREAFFSGHLEICNL